MIAKVNNVSSFGAVIRYVVNKKEQKEFFGEIIEDSAAERIGGWINTTTVDGMIKEFEMIPNRLKHPGKHISLSLPIGDSLNNDTWLELAHDVMNESGYGNAQWVCYKHTDAAHEHVHIVANRKDFELKTVKDSNEKYKFMDIMRKMETKYGLTPYVEDKNKIKETTLERRLSKVGIITDKQELHSNIKVAISKSRNWLDFSDRLKDKGVVWNPRINKQGVETGARFEYKGKTYAGSKVGFSLQRIEEIFFEQEEAKQKEIQKIQSKKSISFSEFAQLIMAKKDVKRLDAVLSKRGCSLKDQSFVAKTYQAFKELNQSDDELRVKISDSFQKWRRKAAREHMFKVDTFFMGIRHSKEDYEVLLNESKGVGTTKQTIQRGLGISGEGFIPFFTELKVNTNNSFFEDVLPKELLVEHVNPVIEKAREFFETRRKQGRNKPLSDASPEVITNHFLALSKTSEWNRRSVNEILTNYKRDNVLKVDLGAFEGRKKEELISLINGGKERGLSL